MIACYVLVVADDRITVKSDDTLMWDENGFEVVEREDIGYLLDREDE